MPTTIVMRRLLVTVTGLALIFWLLAGWIRADVAADTPVVVLAAEEVILHLPVSPSSERIVSDLHLELRTLDAATSDPRIAAALERIEQDHALLEQVALAPVEMFANGEAAATATAVYDIQLDPEQVTVVVVTVELVPGYGSTAGSREHEDGHALINRALARRCAADALRFSVEAGYRGELLIDSMVTLLVSWSTPVHQAYHEYVEFARYGEHIGYAQQALADLTGCAQS